MEQLLATKLFIPPTRPRIVARPRLIERLNDGLRQNQGFGRRLTLISAPAGFGKTTLISEWAETIRLDAETDNRIAWLSLDEGDNDLARFFTYIIAALNRVEGIESNLGEGTLTMLQSPQPPPTEAVLTSLINEIAAISVKIILVLDDFHLIEVQPIHDALTYLVEHLPSQLHLVIATRVDPQLSLARLRARNQLTELRAVDMRFTPSEAADFLNQVMGLNLSSESIAELETRTEGWIAGLQLAAISMRGRKDHTDFIKAFTGSNRLVLDYLVEDVLNHQPRNVQDFLMQTAVLNLLTGSLCDALTNQNNGQMMLERLDHENLFIIPLDEERRWYRYHHLFADLLRQRLKIEQPNLINDLHSMAVIWYETNGNLSEAIHHALARDDRKTATRLIEKGARDALEQSNLRFVLNWVERLQDIDFKEHPWLFIYHSWALLLTGQVKTITPRLENTDWLLDSISKNNETEKQEMLGNIAGLKAILALWQADFKNGLDFANQALEKLPKDNWIRGYCAMFMGSSYFGNGNLNAARGTFAESYSVGKASSNMMLAVSGGCNIAYVLEYEGHLKQAYKIYQDLFQLIEQKGKTLPVAGYINIDFARLLYEMNDLDEAIRHLREGIELCQRLADGRAEKIGYCLLARVQVAKGKFADAVNSIQNADSADPSPGTGFDLRGGEYPQIRLWLKENKLDELESWLKESGANIDEVPIFKTKINHTMHARVLLTLGRERSDGTYLDDAFELLEKLFGLAENNGWGSKVIETLLLKALYFQARGDTDQAITTLEKALLLAEPEGFIRIFVDEGPPMAQLLYETLNRGIAPDYVQRLLAAFPVTEPAETASTKSQVDQSGLIEPLSEREIEVLQLIAEGLTNSEIATRLFLSPHTVKVHARNIRGKFGAHNRTEAVARARALGILSTI